MFSLKNLFANSRHKDSLFSPEEISTLESEIYTKTVRNKDYPYVKCFIRGKEFRLTPEEAVRQLLIRRLVKRYGYEKSQIKLEYPISFGREKKRADIVILEKERPDVAYIIVETKKPDAKDGKDQLKSYCHATGSTMGVWTNGNQISFYQRKNPNYFEDIPDIPPANKKLKDILTERWTIEDLVKNDRLTLENKTLAELIVDLEDEVLANAGVDVFEEVFKLIFAKLYDEMMSARNTKRTLEFRNYGETDAGLKDTIQKLFDEAKKKWEGVFAKEDKIKLTPSHLEICVSSLQSVKLFNSNLEIIDEAFEYLMSKSQKGEKGQYFTPRYVIDMCVKMLNPKEDEFMIDTAAGSCGFPVHTMFHVWRKILERSGNAQSHLLTAEEKPPECIDYANEKIFAIDFDEKAVRVARTLNLIAGDGKANVLWLNSLDYERWKETITQDWIDIYNDGWKGLRALRADKKSNRDFLFDILMANPPFAGDIKESRIIAKYELGKNSKGTRQSKVGRDTLFIERNLQFLKPGGRMAIILPQGRFNNSSDKYIRDFIAERCRILAVVGLHGNVFKPHTGTKTSVLFVQKWDDKLCPRLDDYPIFFATMKKPSKDNSGEKIYATDANGNLLRDANQHLIVDQDLFNNNGLTHDGIAEAFIEFAKRERLSFFDHSSFDEEKYRRLLEELECTEILLSHVQAATNYFRLEAEYHNAKSFSYSKMMKGKDVIASIQYGTSNFCDEDKSSGYPVLRLNELNNGFIEVPQKYCHTLTKLEFEALKLNAGDVMVIRTNGNPDLVGRSAVVMEDTNFAFASYLYRVVPNSLINPETLMSFLNCKYGRIEIDKNSMKGNQTNFSPAKFQDLKIPSFGENLQSRIKENIRVAHDLKKSADSTYHAAEKLFAKELHLENFKPSEENIVVKSFKESFGKTGRLDAEFYQPKYEDLQKFLSTLKTFALGDIAKIFKSIEPGSDFYSNEGIPFIRVSDVTKFGISAPDIKLSGHYDEIYFPGKNTILFSKDGSIGIAYKVREDMTAVTSGALLHLTVKDTSLILPDYLALVLNSKIVKMQAERDSNGAIIQHWKVSEIEKVSVPILPMTIQEKISALMEESFELREESERLLGVAKGAVELAIEQGESAAVAFVEQNLYNP